MGLSVLISAKDYVVLWGSRPSDVLTYQPRTVLSYGAFCPQISQGLFCIVGSKVFRCPAETSGTGKGCISRGAVHNESGIVPYPHAHPLLWNPGQPLFLVTKAHPLIWNLIQPLFLVTKAHPLLWNPIQSLFLATKAHDADS